MLMNMNQSSKDPPSIRTTTTTRMPVMEIRDRHVPATKVLRALSARFLFAAHGLLCIWRVASIYNDSIFWCFGFILVAIFVEGAVLIFYRRANESRWFCASVFLYLCAVAPCLWFLQLELCRKSIRDLASNRTAMTSSGTVINQQETGEAATFDFGGYTVTIYIPLEREVWVQLLQQTMLVTVILGRWVLPKGDITRDHLSQLLLVFLAMAADMVELFDTFKENQVKYNLRLTCVVLAVWTVSTLQFPLVLTGRSTRKPRFGSLKRYSSAPTPTLLHHPNLSRSSRSSSVYHMDPGQHLAAAGMMAEEISFCQVLTTDINFWGVLSGTFLQDGPFLGTRLYLLIEHHTISYTMIFFTCKNILVVALQCYRLLVIFTETAKFVRRARELSDNPEIRTNDFELFLDDRSENGLGLDDDREEEAAEEDANSSSGIRLTVPAPSGSRRPMPPATIRPSKSDGALLPPPPIAAGAKGGGRRKSKNGGPQQPPHRREKKGSVSVSVKTTAVDSDENDEDGRSSLRGL